MLQHLPGQEGESGLSSLGDPGDRVGCGSDDGPPTAGKDKPPEPYLGEVQTRMTVPSDQQGPCQRNTRLSEGGGDRTKEQSPGYRSGEGILKGQRHGGRVPPLGKARRTEIKKLRPVDTVGEGEGGTNRESGTETCTLPHAKLDIASGNLLCDAGDSNLMFFFNLEDWDGVGGGRVVQDVGHVCTPMADSC